MTAETGDTASGRHGMAVTGRWVGPEGAESAVASPAELLEIAVIAAREAGELLTDGDGRVAVAATKSSPTDVVTEMDRRPIDGTVNYLYGLADWAVSIAAEVAGTVVAGVVHLPRHGETFTATLGGGAWLARAGQAPVALRARPGVPLSQALVATGFGYLAARRKIQGEVVAALLPLVRDIRRGGAASVDLCSVAARPPRHCSWSSARPSRPCGRSVTRNGPARLIVGEHSLSQCILARNTWPG